MKMLKKIAVLACVLGMGFALAGCATDDTNPFNPSVAGESGSGSEAGGETDSGKRDVKEFTINVTGTQTLVKNEYAATPQVQIKIPTKLENLIPGDKVTINMKGTASREVQTEMFIVDSTKAGNYWMELSEKHECNIGTTFDFTHTFTIKESPKGTGAEAQVFAINGLDGDTTVTLTCETTDARGSGDNEGSAGTDENSGDEPKVAENNDVVLLDEVWTADWETKKFAADKFENATDESKFVFTVNKNTDQYIDDSLENKYANCYSIMQLLNQSTEGEKFTKGTITGGILEDVNLKPLYQNAEGEPEYDESVVFTVEYTPTKAEWANIKANGVGIQAHGTKISKITLKI